MYPLSAFLVYFNTYRESQLIPDFNDFFDCIDDVTLNDMMIVDHDLQRLWKKLIVVCFKVLSQHLPGETKE
jgi:hypothetical protein